MQHFTLTHLNLKRRLWNMCKNTFGANILCAPSSLTSVRSSHDLCAHIHAQLRGNVCHQSPYKKLLHYSAILLGNKGIYIVSNKPNGIRIRPWPMLHLANCSDGRLSRLWEQPMLRPMLSVTDCLSNKPNVAIWLWTQLSQSCAITHTGYENGNRFYQLGTG